ncbi:uncharacterized protein LOC100677826 isoform X2 [Nasonia vitripennis]|uniref:NACHT domain-containing protein n=1 Tax=Nasonia vitripennis TaxID=7425 RepID=A0A7M7M1Q2_NASVI|nr:uncharacterized protein LOC100677826 isoform X2 [Nasonia vitripennis]
MHPRGSHRPRRAGQPQDRYERLSPHPRRRLTNHARLQQQYRNFQGHSSSDECLARNKSKSTSSIDTQSVNNILDEFEELDYRRSSDLSDIELGCLELANFQQMMDYQRRQHSSRSSCAGPQRQLAPTKVSRQTQVRQRSRDRQAPPAEGSEGLAGPFQPQNPEVRSSLSSAKSPPELLLRKGEVQKRVDEWLSQTRSQNCAGFAKDARPGLTRSNSSAEAKSYRRLRQQEARSRRSQLNGSSSYDDLTACEGLQAKPSVGANTSRGTYKQYLALKGKARLQKQQSNAVLRSREASPSQRPEPLPPEQAARSSKSARARHQMENRISSLIKARNEMAGGEVALTRQASFKRESTRSKSSRQAEPATESGSELRQEHCGPVSARVRAFQGRAEQRAPKSRSLQGSNVLIETRSKSPMSPSRSDGFHPSKGHDRGQSSFKPNAEPDSPARRVEKIYETTLQPEVIHADDLESVFRPGRTNFVYGEACSREAGRDEAVRPPESGLNHCLKLLQRSPSFRLKRREDSCAAKPPSPEQPRQAGFETFHERSKESVESADKSDATSYESRSTLKLNLIESERIRRKEHENPPAKPDSTPSSTSNEPAYSAIRERAPSENGAVVNEVLVKNLQFKQDLPPAPPPRACPPDAAESRREPSPIVKPLNYNSVLNDDYEKVHARQHQQGQLDGGKIYVTKEEMERKKLMDLLRKGQFELAKLELERSYSLSSPGGGSPACCPPCSPPPAPAAYISSARASSRRLGQSNNGPGSPERDPLARLLRHLKSFYRELGTREPAHLPHWASALPGGTLCPAHFQPHLQIVHKSEQEHRLENIRMEQIFAPLGDGSISEAPRRVSVEGGPGSGRTSLCLRLLYQWATQPGESGESGESGGPALALIVPLRELRGGGLLSYLARELFPRGGPLAEAIQQVWRTLQLLEDRLLFLLDGYDECARASLGEAAELLEGRLFPEARLLLTCAPGDAAALGPLVQRRLHLAGLEWARVERLCVAYFIHNDLAERACEFLEVLNVQPLAVRQLAQHPLGWLMLCLLYQDRGRLPEETSALVQAAVRSLVKRSLEPAVPRDEEIPAHCRKRLEDFGRLALAGLREGRTCYPEAELRTRGGGLEVARLGFLSKGPSLGQRRKSELYTPIHLGVAEFLAAYYLSSIAQYANILRRELEGLPPGILGHLAGLLGPRSHLVLNQLCPLELPARGLFSLLRAAGPSEGNVAAVCRLLGAGPGFGPAPSERPPAPLVHTTPLELEGWARILESPACGLEALEVVFQLERGSEPSHLDEFFGALAGNESVRLVRITSLLGHEFPADEVLRLAGHVRSVLGKRRLREFELVVTCLEESAHDRLECVVSALCRALGQASSQLSRLVLDMNLSGEQLSRVCDSLRHCKQVQALHLPHLGCGCEGLASVAELLKERPLLALNLAGSWAAKSEDPSSSGISMGSGSGSGSSGCASSTLGSLPASGRCYSSLPRGALAAYGGSNRPATLPRLPLGLGLPGTAAGGGGGGGGSSSSGNNGSLPSERDSSNGSSKRNSDSLLCHRVPTLHPQPACDLVSHQGTGFHEIFNAIREPNCKLRSLNVSKCLLGGLDACCLAETIRRARNLDAVRAAGASRPADVMPLVLALAEAPCLQLLDLASPRLALDDHPCRLLCHALARNSTLRLLSLEGWTFRIEESETLSVFSELLRCTSVRELSLCNARLHLAVHEGPLSRLGRRDDAGAELLRAAAPPACPDVLFLRLAGFQVTVNDRVALRGPLLLPFLAGFTGLSELDLSLDKSTVGGGSGSGSSLLSIDDRTLIQFFGCLGSSFRGLQSLRINFWRVSLDESEKTLRQVGKQLRNCLSLSFLKASGLVVTDSSKKTRQEHGLIQAFLGNLHSLAWLCLDGVELTESQATAVGKCLRERFAGPSLEISAKDVQVRALKALVASVEEAGKAEVLYAGGAACRLKITKLHKSTKARKK